MLHSKKPKLPIFTNPTAQFRFHYLNHDEDDCTEFCSPNDKDDPLLWHRDDNDEPKFNWNSSIAESNNAYFHGTFHGAMSCTKGKGPRYLCHIARGALCYACQ